MLKSYFKTAWRNLIKNKFSSVINIGGLAIGMTVSLLIGLWIYDELSFDTYHTNYNHIARVMQQQTANGIISSNEAVPLPLATELQTHYHDDFKYVVVSSWMGDHVLKYNDKTISQSGMYMQQDAARMLTLKMIEGNYDGLKDMHSILLSESATKTFFGNDDPVNGVQSSGLIQYVCLFGIIGVFVLLLACINFMNLSTAQSEKRAKEIGIRKAIGSVRSQVVRQFYIESLLIVVFAFLLSILLVQLSLPWFNDLSNKQMSIPWGNSAFWIIAAVFIIITNAVAGSYPALYLSSFQPLKVLKGTWRAGRFASMPRKVLG